MTIGGQADTVTGCAEGLAHGVNEANLAYAVAEGVAARRFGGIAGGNGDQWAIFGLDNSLEFRACEDVFFAPDLIGIQRHKFDPAHHIGFAPRQAHEFQRFLFAVAFNGHRIHLDGMDRWIFFKLFQPFQHAGKLIPARELRELLAYQRIEAHVDASKSCLGERARQLFQEDAIGRQAETAQPFDLAQLAHKFRDIAPHKRFSTRQANLLDADAHRNARDAFDFFVGEYLRLLQPGQALGWHAVGAAKVALIGNRNAHAFNAASVAVNEQFHRSVSLSPG